MRRPRSLNRGYVLKFNRPTLLICVHQYSEPHPITQCWWHFKSLNSLLLVFFQNFRRFPTTSVNFCISFGTNRTPRARILTVVKSPLLHKAIFLTSIGHTSAHSIPCWVTSHPSSLRITYWFRTLRAQLHVAYVLIQNYLLTTIESNRESHSLFLVAY